MRSRACSSILPTRSAPRKIGRPGGLIGFRVYGLGFKFCGLGFRVQGLRIYSLLNQAPSNEDPKTRNSKVDAAISLGILPGGGGGRGCWRSLVLIVGTYKLHRAI